MHPCSVARILAEELDIRDLEILAAALLHDTVEDVEEVTGEVIRERFGANVEAIVEGCTVTNYTGDRQTFKKLVHRKIFMAPRQARGDDRQAGGPAAQPAHPPRACRATSGRRSPTRPRHPRPRRWPPSSACSPSSGNCTTWPWPASSKAPGQLPDCSRTSTTCATTRRSFIIDNVRQGIDHEGLDGTVTLRPKGLWGLLRRAQPHLIKRSKSPARSSCSCAPAAAATRPWGRSTDRPPLPRTIRDFIANPAHRLPGLHARANIGGRQFLQDPALRRCPPRPSGA